MTRIRTGERARGGGENETKKRERGGYGLNGWGGEGGGGEGGEGGDDMITQGLGFRV